MVFSQTEDNKTQQLSEYANKSPTISVIPLSHFRLGYGDVGNCRE